MSFLLKISNFVSDDSVICLFMINKQKNVLAFVYKIITLDQFKKNIWYIVLLLFYKHQMSM